VQQFITGIAPDRGKCGANHLSVPGACDFLVRSAANVSQQIRRDESLKKRQTLPDDFLQFLNSIKI
jgi:hypothetical protein